MNMKKQIEDMIEFLPQISKYESDLIKMALTWPKDQQAAFLWAKDIFEENMEKLEKNGEKILSRPSSRRKSEFS